MWKEMMLKRRGRPALRLSCGACALLVLWLCSDRRKHADVDLTDLKSPSQHPYNPGYPADGREYTLQFSIFFFHPNYFFSFIFPFLGHLEHFSDIGRKKYFVHQEKFFFTFFFFFSFCPTCLLKCVALTLISALVLYVWALYESSCKSTIILKCFLPFWAIFSFFFLWKKKKKSRFSRISAFFLPFWVKN